MQLDMFEDERMKILYSISFMHGGIAQVWAENETNRVLFHMSMFSTLAELLASIERTFNDPDWEGWLTPSCMDNVALVAELVTLP